MLSHTASNDVPCSKSSGCRGRVLPLHVHCYWSRDESHLLPGSDAGLDAGQEHSRLNEGRLGKGLQDDKGATGRHIVQVCLIGNQLRLCRFLNKHSHDVHKSTRIYKK